MEFLQPASWAEALAMKAAHPEALPIAGGTDVMVEINFDRQRPATIIDLTRIAELNEWGMDSSFLRIGAGVTYTRIIDELGRRLPDTGRGCGCRLCAESNAPRYERRHRDRGPDGSWSTLHRWLAAMARRVSGGMRPEAA